MIIIFYFKKENYDHYADRKTSNTLCKILLERAMLDKGSHAAVPFKF